MQYSLSLHETHTRLGTRPAGLAMGSEWERHRTTCLAAGSQHKTIGAARAPLAAVEMVAVGTAAVVGVAAVGTIPPGRDLECRQEFLDSG